MHVTQSLRVIINQIEFLNITCITCYSDNGFQSPKHSKH